MSWYYMIFKTICGYFLFISKIINIFFKSVSNNNIIDKVLLDKS